MGSMNKVQPYHFNLTDWQGFRSWTRYLVTKVVQREPEKLWVVHKWSSLWKALWILQNFKCTNPLTQWFYFLKSILQTDLHMCESVIVWGESEVGKTWNNHKYPPLGYWLNKWSCSHICLTMQLWRRMTQFIETDTECFSKAICLRERKEGRSKEFMSTHGLPCP